jgi:hypothetical protein
MVVRVTVAHVHRQHRASLSCGASLADSPCPSTCTTSFEKRRGKCRQLVLALPKLHTATHVCIRPRYMNEARNTPIRVIRSSETGHSVAATVVALILIFATDHRKTVEYTRAQINH